jgi:hypothetical protein
VIARRQSGAPMPGGRLVPALLAAALAAGCRAGARRAGDGEEAPAEAPGEPSPVAAHAPDRELWVADVRPGRYGDDPRLRALAADWTERVARAAARLEVLTGLGFSDRGSPHVTLGPLDDERVDFLVEPEVSGGRRRARVLVNCEPILGRDASADRTLLEALAHAALLVRPRGDAAPEWARTLAGVVATGDLAERVERLAAATLAGAPRPAVDPDDERASEATGVAAATLLSLAGDPPLVRRLLSLVADGEDAAEMLDRAQSTGSETWVVRARRALSDALDAADLAAERAVADLREAARSLGPEGVDLAASDRLARWARSHGVHAEADALRLSGALALGDGARARAVLSARPPDPATLRLLEDPGDYLLGAAQAHALSGGDRALARALFRRHLRDFPAHPGRADALRALASLAADAPRAERPALFSLLVSERALDASTAALWVRQLLAEHRPGAARRFLEAFADGPPPELLEVVAEVDRAEASPPPETRAAVAARVSRHAARPSEETADDVADGGLPAARAVLEALPPPGDPRRRASVRLLVRAAGVARAAALLARRWDEDARGFDEDVDALAGVSGYAELSAAVLAAYPPAGSDARAQAGWERALLGLDPEFLADRDDLLRRARSDDPGERGTAFEEVVRAGRASAPAFLLRFSRDPSLLLRRRAVAVAGREGVLAVPREALRDASWAVRQEACAALVAGRDADAVPLLVPCLRDPDPDPRVRAAAAHALLALGPKDERVARVLVRQLRGRDATLADDVSRRLPLLDAEVAARALAWGLEEEAARTPEDRTVLFRLFVAFRRVTGSDLGYHPAMPIEEVRARVARVREAQRARAPR